ncbi:MAG: outer membrane beta-barrel protein [Gammaproteobacteria bacterium]|nr:outer membrane beta-barrel protein [Gammaproteobacteria bacterium]MBU1645372.1 outer membrane beta-barrel protein [Gammaproteobacteria bacterium]MBU1972365.1 outer membrane beta-barrel protein [Gammaproteobacteria bacterium]
MRRFFQLGAFSVLFLGSSYASAAGPEWFISGSLGASRYSDYRQSISNLVADSVAIANPGILIVASTTQDATDVGFKGSIGAWFNDNIGAEVGYANLGESTANTITTGVVTTWRLTQKNQVGFGSVLLGGKLDPSNRLYAKLGAYSASTDLSASVTGPGGSLSTGTDSTNTGVLYGVGWETAMSKQIAFRMEVERFNKVGDTNKTGEGSIDLFSVGLTFKF